MTVSTFVQPNYNTQTGTAYPLNLDAGFAAFLRQAGAFAPHEQSTPNMTVRLDAGHIFAGGNAVTEVAAQSTGTITAPSTNPRKDIVHVDRATGVVGVATGAEAASPVDPAIPAGKVPVARINLTTSTTAIANSIIDDIRSLNWLGTGRQTIWVPAAAITPRTTNGAASGTVELATNKNMLRTLDYDSAAQEFGQIEIAMPKSWDRGSVSAQAVWTAASGSGGVVFALQAVATSDDDALDVAFGSEQTMTDTLLAANDCHVSPESAAITVAGSPAESDRVQFQVKRNVADASDTLAVDAKLLGIRLFYTVNAGNDA